LTLNSGARVQVIGPVILRVANSVSVNGGSVGAAAHSEWLEFEIANGSLALNSGSTVNGNVTAPKGTVTLNNGTTINGRVAADRLTINGSGVIDDPAQ
jgi:rhamnogalacturonan endolyase